MEPAVDRVQGWFPTWWMAGGHLFMEAWGGSSVRVLPQLDGGLAATLDMNASQFEFISEFACILHMGLRSEWRYVNYLIHGT